MNKNGNLSSNAGRATGRLRIALVMRDYASGRGGAERYFVNLSRALAGMGHEVHIFAARFGETETDRIHFHRVPMKRKPAFLRLLSFFLNARSMIERQKSRLDLVLSLTMVYPCDIFRLGGEVQREWLRIRCPSPYQRAFKFLFNPVHILNHYFEKRIMNGASTKHVITISALERDMLLKYYNYPKERITVVYNGVDHQQFHPGVRKDRPAVREALGICEQDVVGLFPANNFHRKGLDSVIAGLSRIPEADRPIILVAGRGKTYVYRRQAKRLGVEGSVRFLGSVQTPERYYGASDFLILPSRYDSFGNVHLEALACGLPVITTRMAGGSEVVRDGETGFVVDRSESIEDLASGMIRLGDLEVRKRMSALAAESVREFTTERNAVEILEVIGRVLRQNNTSR